MIKWILKNIKYKKILLNFIKMLREYLIILIMILNINIYYVKLNNLENLY